MSTSPESSDPLAPVLRDAEAELSRRLHQACEAEAKGVANESSTEIRQLEDALLAAAVAAEHTLSLRRHMEKSSAKPPCATEDTAIGMVREFTDGGGSAWRAWPVTPGLSRTTRSKHFLGDFRGGWICFEGVGTSARRRLPGHPPRWAELNQQELDGLLQRALSVKERKPADASAQPQTQ